MSLRHDNNLNHHSNSNSNGSNDTKGQRAMCPNADVQNASQPLCLACLPAHFPSPAGCHRAGTDPASVLGEGCAVLYKPQPANEA